MAMMLDRADATVASGGNTPIDCYIGARIRLARERRAASPEDLAQAVGATASLIASYEAGREKVRPAMLHKIAVTLDVTLGSLFGIDTA